MPITTPRSSIVLANASAVPALSAKPRPRPGLGLSEPLARIRTRPVWVRADDRKRFLNRDEIAGLLAAASDAYRLAIATAVFSGVRIK